MKKVKIIYINTYICYSRPLSEMAQDQKWFYLFGMGHVLAEQLIKRNPEILVENWRADHSISERKEKMVEGIMCRVFPAKELFKFGDFSFELVKELKAQALQYALIIHFMGSHRLFYNYIAWKLKKNAIVATHLGGGNPRWRYEQTRNLPSWFYWKLEEKFFLIYFGYYFCQTDTEKEYVASVIGSERVSKTAIFGVDLNVFKTISKKEARKKLGFPQNKKIILQVGRAVRSRGVDVVLKVWENIKSSELYFYMVDIHPTDELYPQVIESCENYCGKVNFMDLPYYYNAADLLIYLPLDDESLNFAGTSYVPLEAMACGTPVVAFTLRHFPDDEIKIVCRVPYNIDEVVPMVMDLLKNPPNTDQCRSLVKKYYDWDAVITKHLEIYKKLLYH